MDPLIWLFLAALVAGLLMIITFSRGFFTSKRKNNASAAVNVRGGGQRAEMAGGMRRTRNIRSRIAAVQRERARQAETIQQEAAEEDEREDDVADAGSFDEEEDEGLKAFSGKKVGTKKLRRLQEKAEKKAMREQEEAMREDRKRREALKEEERQRELEEERIQEAQEEEEHRRLKEEQERKEHEEYLKLKESFVVEGEGETAVDEEDKEVKTVREFVEYIKTHKVVYMEDLAAAFGMKTQEAISRVHSLQENRELSGVVDDRGKFIYISEEELQAVANFIKQRGRVSIVELVSSSNRLINLQPEQAVSNTVGT